MTGRRFRRSKGLDVMGAQLSRLPGEFEGYVGPQGDPRRAELLGQLRIDWAFIAAYWAIFAASSGLLAARDFSAAVWLGVFAAECGTAAAVLDVSENVQTLRLLEATALDGTETQLVMRRMRHASLAKWFFAFFTTGLLSSNFLERSAWWDILIGSLYALAAALGLMSALAAAARPSGIPARIRTNMLRGSFVLMGLSLSIGLPFAAALL